MPRLGCGVLSCADEGVVGDRAVEQDADVRAGGAAEEKDAREGEGACPTHGSRPLSRSHACQKRPAAPQRKYSLRDRKAASATPCRVCRDPPLSLACRRSSKASSLSPITTRKTSRRRSLTTGVQSPVALFLLSNSSQRKFQLVPHDARCFGDCRAHIGCSSGGRRLLRGGRGRRRGGGT